MSCFRIEDTYEDPDGTAAESIRRIATVQIKPARAVFAAAAGLAARLAGSNLVVVRPGTPLVDPARAVRDLLEAAYLPIAADLGCAGPLSAQQLVAAGAQKVVVSTEALLHPEIVREVTSVIGSEASIFHVDCVANGPGRIEVLDGSNRSTGIDCAQWLDQIQGLGATNVILRPHATLPSEGLLSLIRERELKVYLERPGWNLGLADALGAAGIVTEGALGCREQLEQEGLLTAQATR